jgi:outer membrane protein assembly factor BamB
MRLPRATARLALSLLGLLLCITATGCGGRGGSASDALGAYNTLGGAARANDFSRSGAPPVSSLVPTSFPALKGGLLGPPLEIPLGRMALIARADTVAVLAVIYRDSLLWSFRFPVDEYPMQGIAADSAGTIYTISTRGLLRAFSPDGKPLWSRETQEDLPADRFVVPAPLLATADGVVAGNSFGGITRFDRSGRRIWHGVRGAAIDAPFAADPALGLVTGLTHNSYDMADTLLLLDLATGAPRWSRPMQGGRIVAGPVLAGSLIVVGEALRGDDEHRSPFVTAFGRDGRQLWRVPLLLMPRGIAADNAGNLYVACSGAGREANGGAILSLDTTGRKRWEVSLESGIPAAPAISADWIYFISRRDGRTGLFTYGHDGVFRNFLSINILPDVHAQSTISSFGELILAGLDQPAILRGSE